MITMTPHLAIDIVHAKTGMTTDIIPDATVVTETTTMSVIEMITVIDRSVLLEDQEARASVGNAVMEELEPGELNFESQCFGCTNKNAVEVFLRS